MLIRIMRLRRSGCALALSALLAASVASNAAGASNRAYGIVNHASLQRAVSCMVSSNRFQVYALTFVNLRLGDLAAAKLYSGSIVDKSYNGKIYNILLYSKNGKRLVVWGIIPDKNDNLEITQTGYLLAKHGDAWHVEEGNGGYRDYEAIEKFATSLSHKPYRLVRVVSQSNACTSGISGQKHS